MLSRKIGLDQITRQLKNSKVLMRVDFNVPLKEGKVSDPARILGALPSIKKILSENPKSLVLASHLGRPDGHKIDKYSLKPVAPVLEKLLGTKVNFLNESVGSEVEEIVKQARSGEVFLLENVRFHPEEEGKYIDASGNKVKVDAGKIAEFRKSFNTLGEVFVNDAFGTAHRAHSSVVGVNHKVRAAGYLMKKELEFFAKALEHPEKPFLVVLGGAKVKDKIPLIFNMLDKVDEMIIGGGMSYTFLKKIHGINIGTSLFDKEGYEAVDSILAKAKQRGVKIHLPVDFLITDKFDGTGKLEQRDLKEGIPDGWSANDAGEKTRKYFNEVVNNANLIVWNGPLGYFELDMFKGGSVAMLNSIVERTKKGATSIIGGGDSVNLVHSVKGADANISHVSTGGGAALELLEGKTLPGVAHLTNADEL